MGNKEKLVPINPLAIDQIQKDLSSDGVCYYEPEDIPPEFIDPYLIHPEVMKKCSHIVTAISGSNEDGRKYMFIAPVRVDKEGNKYVTDLDPIIMVSDLETGSPMASGCVRFHGTFSGRTEETGLSIEQYSFEKAVAELRTTVSGTKCKFEEAPERFTYAMHYMAKCYRRNYE